MSYVSFHPKLLFGFGVVGLVIVLSAATAFAWSNTASKTIALATAALWSAGLFLVLQLCLELRASDESDFVSFEFTVDRAKTRVWTREAASPVTMMRQAYEQGSSEWLAQNSPKVFSEDRERLTHDFALPKFSASTNRLGDLCKKTRNSPIRAIDVSRGSPDP